MKYLLDTNIISELRKKTPDIRVMEWFSNIHPSQLYLSCLTIGEIKIGVLKIAKKDKATSLGLMKWLDSLIIDYAEKIIGVNLEICEEWAELMSIDSTNAIDSLIAAQAKQRNIILVTRNIKHYSMFDIRIFNPFDTHGSV
ncbi:type II toxin-antitoxin system VapC family toxin [Rickettsia endosymbiont of Orchestes rusci]|uniref:type II toxin-antitoxin system VapC family toxin n=1 Tax=Rickettsia endosymbiont of Orchestes rusci TaxID=3066250 RepID=UPI00313D31DB